MAVLLFSYGTLQQAEVQVATYGRPLSGTADALRGFRLEPLEIRDPHVVAVSGKAIHTIARPSPDPEARIQGTVFEVSEEELAASDRYEVSDYVRAELTLESGRKAWVYVDGSSGSSGNLLAK